MPELPEVESYRRLASSVRGRTVTSIATPDSWFLKEGATGSRLRRALVGHEVVEARRIGKIVLLDLDDGDVLGLRFGMTGTLLVDGHAGVDRLIYSSQKFQRKWDRFTMRFEQGSLVIHDPRRLGGVSLNPDLSRLGPDAVSITGAQLGAALRGSTAPLKARLLDQAKVAGIGNLIADEILWRASLSPLRPAGSLSTTEVRRLHRTLHRTLTQLLERGGSHLGDLMDERHRDGRCPKDGTLLFRDTVGGRTTYWCPVHQV
ncbi:MAG TPA: DNA-formamidopyrimidine glycosylase family protein [Acidimicrobiales bacterium]|nr:DNA-formamidopyrimidine glycosylase family protein [Acidimicrobiales bacterium]